MLLKSMLVQDDFQGGGRGLGGDPGSRPQLTPGLLPSFPVRNLPPPSPLGVASCHLPGERPHLCFFPLWRRDELRSQALTCPPGLGQTSIPQNWYKALLFTC